MASGFSAKRDGAGHDSSLLPPGEISEFGHIETPVDHGGSFSLGGVAAQSMAERFIRPSIRSTYHRYTLPDYPTRPIDELTGLPYCFAPNPDLPAVLPRGQNHLREGDLDHHFPKVETKHGGNPVLELPFARMALMNLRVQWSTFEDHHDKWNKLPVIGPMQPRTPQQLAATVLFGLSMYIPPVALTLHNDHFVETWLDALERSRMVESGQIQVANEQEGINYLQWYVMAQEVDHIKQVQLDEFLHTFNRERKIYLAHTLAAKIVERAVEPFEGAYTKAYKQGMLSVRQASGVVRAPANPRDLVKAKLTTGRRFGVIMDAMAHRLAGHRDALLVA